MAKQTKNSKAAKPNKASNKTTNKATSKKKRFSTTDYVAFAIFALILASIIGVTGFYYGVHRPQASEIVRERAEEFTEIYFDIDYEKGMDVESLSEYLVNHLALTLRADAEAMNRNRRANEMIVTVNEVESEIVNVSWDTAKVKVNFNHTESTVTKDETASWGIVYFDFRKVGDEWQIERYLSAPQEEIDELNSQRN